MTNAFLTGKISFTKTDRNSIGVTECDSLINSIRCLLDTKHSSELSASLDLLPFERAIVLVGY